jgi:hypothetical protein
VLKKVIVSACVVLLYLTPNVSALSDTTDDGTGTISARGENLPSEGMAKAFDNNTATKWLDFSPSSSWIQYRYAADKRSVVTEYTLTSANDFQERDPMNWNILGSNNGGASWVTLDTRTNELFTARFQKRSFQFTNSTAYNIYRLSIAQLRGPAPNSVQLAEIELIGTTPEPPAKATSPSPANSATGVSITATLSWTAGSGAASHDVYFGTAFNDVNSAERLLSDLNGNGIVDWDDMSILSQHWLLDPAGTEPYAGVDDDNIVDFFDYALFAQDWMNSAGLVFKGNQDANSYNPGTLALNTTYCWRVDEVNGPNTVTGDVWSFTAQSGKAYNPSPANSVSNVAVNPTLSWSAGYGAASHDVYFGTTSPGTFQTNQTGTTYIPPGPLANSTVYYWRINEVNGPNTITGDVWNFTTVPLSTTPVYPYLTWRNNPTNSVVVSWLNADAQGDSTVDYGTTSSYGTTVTVPTVTNCHHVELTGLTAGATYHYRVRSSDGTLGSDNTYTVPVSSPASFRFAVYGDPRGTSTANEPYYTRHQVLCNWILAQNYDFSLETGDTVWAGCATASCPLLAEGYYNDFFRLESNLSKSKVIMATMGNHEVQTPSSCGSATYTYYYDLYTGAFPTNGTSGNTGRVYSFDYGNAHFICLSSYQISLTTQATWLEADLIAARANPNIKWIFAFMHAPMYTTNTSRPNRTDEIAAWGPLFDTYHVDIVFAGHNHLLERSKSIKNGLAVPDGNGTVYITTGLGGASFDSPGSGSPGLFVYTYNSQTLATCVTIDGNSLTVNSITNADNIVRDTFTLQK